MVKKRPFDWEALRAYIKSVEALPKGNQIPVTEELKFFVRFRRFTSRWAQVADPIAAESAMIDLAEELRLDWRRAARLYVRLQQQASLHILGRDLDAFERARNASKELQTIRNSLERIKKFSERLLAEAAGPSEVVVEKRLENAAHFWADRLRLESEMPRQYDKWESAKAHGFNHVRVPVPTRGFEPNPAVPVFYHHTYDAHVVVRTWLRNNVLFSKLVAEIINQRPSEVSDPTGTEDLSSVQYLAVVVLPKLYEQCTGEKYRFSTASGGSQLRNTRGPKFVSLCYPVMGLPKPSLKTLRTHWQSPEARKRPTGVIRSYMCGRA